MIDQPLPLKIILDADQETRHVRAWREINNDRLNASFEAWFSSNWTRLYGPNEETDRNKAMCKEGWDAAMKVCQETFDKYEEELR